MVRTETITRGDGRHIRTVLVPIRFQHYAPETEAGFSIIVRPSTLRPAVTDLVRSFESANSAELGHSSLPRPYLSPKTDKQNHCTCCQWNQGCALKVAVPARAKDFRRRSRRPRNCRRAALPLDRHLSRGKAPLDPESDPPKRRHTIPHSRGLDPRGRGGYSRQRTKTMAPGYKTPNPWEWPRRVGSSRLDPVDVRASSSRPNGAFAGRTAAVTNGRAGCHPAPQRQAVGSIAASASLP